MGASQTQTQTQTYILALDQGTTSSRAALYDADGRVVSCAHEAFEQVYPHDGWVEHAPADLLYSQMSAVHKALHAAHVTAASVAAIGITNQRETTLVWDRVTGEPVYNAIVWQCRRTSELCEKLKTSGFEAQIRSRTGLVADPYFSATKLKWILDNVPDARKRAEDGALLFGTVDTYLLWHLTGGRVHATDYSNAARTMLFNIHDKAWDDALLRAFDIPRCMLPAVRPSSHVYGYTDTDLLPGRIPVCGVAGDQQAALFGHLCTAPGTAKNTYGTGCFLLMNTGTEAIGGGGMLTTLAADAAVGYVLEGSVFSAGSCMQWLRDGLRLFSDVEDTAAIAAAAGGTGGVYLVPAFTGLGAPHWNPYARGTISGLTRGTSAAHLIRAGLESIAYQTYDLLEAMRAQGAAVKDVLAVDGGACAN
ncbi:MAG: glycerol kinase, partial [Clostridiales bacterium]|nr:glycerol kinase [Clostridiales bacterium]